METKQCEFLNTYNNHYTTSSALAFDIEVEVRRRNKNGVYYEWTCSTPTWTVAQGICYTLEDAKKYGLRAYDRYVKRQLEIFYQK